MRGRSDYDDNLRNTSVCGGLVTASPSWRECYTGVNERFITTSLFTLLLHFYPETNA